MPVLLLPDFFSLNDDGVFVINFWGKRTKYCKIMFAAFPCLQWVMCLSYI